MVLNEHAQSNGSPEVPCTPVFKLHSKIFWLEGPAKVERGDASRRDGGRQGDGSFVLSWAFILDSIACSTALSVKVKPSGWQPLIDGLILVGSRSVVAAYFTL